MTRLPLRPAAHMAIGIGLIAGICALCTLGLAVHVLGIGWELLFGKDDGDLAGDHEV